MRDLMTQAGQAPDLVTWERRFNDPDNRRVDRAATVPTGRATVAQGPLVTNRRIAFVASSDTFLRPIVNHFAAHNDVRCVFPQSSAELAEIMRWAELTWFEWCDALVIQGSQLRKSGKLICRLHSYEAFTDYPRQVNWRNVDRLVFVNRSVEEILDGSGQYPVSRAVIANGVDPERFPLINRGRRGKKIASVGYINYKKNPSLLLQTFKAIHDRDPEFELHIAGTHQDPRIKVYFEHLLSRMNLPVTFHGWVEEMPAFYADMDYVISTSLFESFHYSIAEGMLSGCLPLVHSWKGADYLYPENTLFDTPGDACALIERYQHENDDRLVQRHRQHIIDRFNWPDRLDEIDKMLHAVLMGERGEEPQVERESIAVSRPVPTMPSQGSVSIIIPVVENSPVVATTVKSALKQSYHDTEIIVADATATGLPPFGDSVKIIKCEHPTLTAALNRGMQECASEFVVFCLPGDRMTPERIGKQVQRLAADSGLGMTRCGWTAPDKTAPKNSPTPSDTPVEESVPASAVMIRRAALQQSGWFEEANPAGLTDAQLCDALWHRMSQAHNIDVDTESLVQIADRTIDQAPSTEDRQRQMIALSERWDHGVPGNATTSRGVPARTSSTGTMKIALVGASDPDGQMAMWAEACNRYSGVSARVLTHRTALGFPSDLTLRHELKSSGAPVASRPLMETIAEAESVVAEADVVIFAAGSSSAANSKDARLADTDEQPFGTLRWADLIKGKRCAALLCGTPSVHANLPWYHERLTAKGWPLMTADPLIHRYLPDVQWLPPVWMPGNEDDQLIATVGPECRIAVAGSPHGSDADRMIEQVLRAQVKSNTGCSAEYCHDLTWNERLEVLRHAQCGIDRLDVGRGAFSAASLMHSALGLVNIVYCDPYTRGLLCRTLGTDENPWEMPGGAAELSAVLDRYMNDPDLLQERMTETRTWFAQYWNAETIISQVTEVLAGL
jgi:hypothetical protein